MLGESDGVRKSTGALNDSDLEEISLDLKDRALAVAAEGITIADIRLPDEPLIYVNEGFERLTLYSASEIIGRNCRFLQGSETDRSVVAELREAIQARRECSVEILNYRKDGVPFWNRLSLTPVRNSEGQTTHYIGVQSDITKRREAEIKLRLVNEKLEVANQKMTRDLETAAKIQQSLLPENMPQIEEVSFCWKFEPCDELAGDTLNVLPLDREHVAFYTLDVSGHGVPAALLSVSLSHWLSAAPGRSCLLSPLSENESVFVVTAPGEVAEILNEQFPMDLDTAQYFTIAYGVLNVRNGRLRYVAAGSPPPLMVTENGETHVLEGRGLPIGMIAEPSYQEQTIDLSPGDRVFLYTDGIIEVENSQEEQFSMNQLAGVVGKGHSASLNDCLGLVMASVDEWNSAKPLEDDATILALEFHGG
jgi:PAS domain S-box-containing protein